MTDTSLHAWQTAQEHEQEFWESYADTYERYPQILLEHLSRLSDAGEFIRDELSSPDVEEALEVGVGPLGVGVLGVRARGLHITAIDPLPRIDVRLGDTTLDTYVRALRDGVNYRCSQGETMAFSEDSFDLVCCHNVIDHARNPITILEEMFRVLKAGKSLYLTLNTFSYIGRLKFETMRRFSPRKMIFACHPHSFLHSDILNALARSGYEMIRHEGGEHAFAGPARLSKFLCRKPASR